MSIRSVQKLDRRNNDPKTEEKTNVCPREQIEKQRYTKGGCYRDLYVSQDGEPKKKKKEEKLEQKGRSMN